MYDKYGICMWIMHEYRSRTDGGFVGPAAEAVGFRLNGAGVSSLIDLELDFGELGHVPYDQDFVPYHHFSHLRYKLVTLTVSYNAQKFEDIW